MKAVKLHVFSKLLVIQKCDTSVRLLPRNIFLFTVLSFERFLIICLFYLQTLEMYQNQLIEFPLDVIAENCPIKRSMLNDLFSLVV